MRVLVLLVALAACASAQSKGWDRVIGTAQQSTLRVVTMDGQTHEGRLLKVNTESLTLAAKSGEVAVQAASVKRVQLRVGSRRARNMAIGAGIGVGVGITAAGLACLSCFGEMNSDDNNRRLGLGALGGGAIGAALGAIPAPYKTIYKRRK